MAVDVFVANEQSDPQGGLLPLARLAEGALEAEGVHGDAELSVLFVDERDNRRVERALLRAKGPPTCSPSRSTKTTPRRTRPRQRRDGSWLGAADEAALPTMIGDIVICPEVAFKNAPGHTGTYDDELALLLVHGLLHLLGIDHEQSDEAEEIEEREQELLDALFRKPKS